MVKYVIRKFSIDDSREVRDIFNYFVEKTFAAYPEERVGYVFISRLEESIIHDFFYVIELSGRTIGFGLLKEYHSSDVFSRTAELSYFILPEHARKGLGTRLLRKLEDDAKTVGIDNLMAHISSHNEASISFHKKHGFIECGRFRRIGRKKGQDFDVVWMQKFI